MTESHPLEPAVWAAFAATPAHDGTSLGFFLAGPYRLKGSHRTRAKVAREVLGYMEQQGKLERDQCGWWRKA